MKCLLLAAGFDTRLYPLTENFPKPLLPVQGKPILDWLIGDIDRLGAVDEYIVISNHKFVSQFRDWAAGRHQRITVLDDGTSTNETRLGAVKDLQLAIDTCHLDDDLLVIAGDNLLDFSLTRFIHYAREKNTSCIMRYAESDPAKLKKCGVVTVNAYDLVLDMAEKPTRPASEWVSPPFYFYTRKDAALIRVAIAAGCGVDAPGSLVAWLCRQVPVHAMRMPGRRYDIGDLASYRLVEEEYGGIR